MRIDESDQPTTTMPSKMPVFRPCPKCGAVATWEEVVYREPNGTKAMVVIAVNYLCDRHKKMSYKKQIKLVKEQRKLPVEKRKDCPVHYYKPLVDSLRTPPKKLPVSRS